MTTNKPVWAEWVSDGRLPELPDGWKWGNGRLRVVHRAGSMVKVDRYAVTVVTLCTESPRGLSMATSGDLCLGVTPVDLIVPLLEARRLWVAAGGAL